MYQINVKADGSVLIRHVVHVPHVVAADQNMPTLVRGFISRPIFAVDQFVPRLLNYNRFPAPFFAVDQFVPPLLNYNIKSF